MKFKGYRSTKESRAGFLFTLPFLVGFLMFMDENEVEKAVLLQGNYIGFQNLYSYEAVRKYPDRFLSAASYDPYSRNKDAIVRHLFEELRIPIVKFEVSTGSGLMSSKPSTLKEPIVLVFP